MFWSISAAVLFAAALIVLFPLLRAKSLWQPFALAMVFLLPAAAMWIYIQIGTPDAIDLAPPPPRQASTNEAHSPDSSEMDSMVEGLRDRLTESPEDLDGWLLLARTLKATQRFSEAAEALETANRIAPNNPQVMVDLVETRIFLTPDGMISDDSVAILTQILDQYPDMQKALWLIGIASSQAGDDAFAISYWESLMEHLETGSPAAQSVQSQINQAQARMGMDVAEAAAVPAPDDGTWQGTRVTVKADQAGQSGIPAGGVLYVMIRTAGPVMGPPLGVRRVIGPSLPLELTIDDEDSMLKERKISSESEIQLQARISLTGSPAASSGDWQSETVTVALDSAQDVELLINQRVE